MPRFRAASARPLADETDLVILELVRLSTSERWTRPWAVQKLAAKQHRRAALLAAERKLRFVRDTWPNPISERAAVTLVGALAVSSPSADGPSAAPEVEPGPDGSGPTGGGNWAHGELTRLNRDPVSFLAELAIPAGVPHHVAFYQAQELLLSHGTNRRIDPDSATRLCARMLEWAGRFERSRPVGR